jgi:hypothetical protein
MSTFIKTYITAAPWRAILLYGLIFAILVGGIQVLVRYKNGESYTSGSWYEELAM